MSVNLKRAHYADRGRKPAVRPPRWEGIPPEMAAAPRWLLWRLEWVERKSGSGEWSKVPYRATGRGKASSTDPATWATLAAARAAYDRGGLDGVGFVLGNGWAGIDLDNAINAETGEVNPKAAALMDAAGVYTEVSPSGTGFKAFGRGTWNAGRNRKPLDGPCEIEVYGGGRYFAVTGDGGGPAGDLQPTLDRLAATVFAPNADARPAAPPPARQLDLSDEELLDRIRRSKQGPKFVALFDRGDTSAYGGDHSRAELGLCGTLAFWCQGDAERIDRLFRASALMRPKWDRPDYRTKTIAKAVADLKNVYDPDRRSGPTPTIGKGCEVAGDEEQTGAVIIRDYFRERYRPVFRDGNTIHAASGEVVFQAVACSAAPSRLIARLAAAADAPSFKGGGVNHGALPGFFRKWAPTAWADVLDELATEEEANVSADCVAGERFRRLVREAMLTETSLGGLRDGGPNVERRSQVDWCQRFAKPGPWASVRSKWLYCRAEVDAATAEITYQIALRHEFFSQLKADRRLTEMGHSTFAKLARKYGVGELDEGCRPRGVRFVVLYPGFVNELLTGVNAVQPAAESGGGFDPDEWFGKDQTTVSRSVPD